VRHLCLPVSLSEHCTACTAQHAQHSMHSTIRAAWHAQHCMHSTTRTALHAQHCMHSTACTALHALHYLHSTICTARHARHYMPSTACTALHAQPILGSAPLQTGVANPRGVECRSAGRRLLPERQTRRTPCVPFWLQSPPLQIHATPFLRLPIMPEEERYMPSPCSLLHVQHLDSSAYTAFCTALWHAQH